MSVKDYLNPHERFAQRMKRSMQKSKENEEGGAMEEQRDLFTRDAKITGNLAGTTDTGTISSGRGVDDEDPYGHNK